MLKEKGWALKVQLQADYDAAASAQDILAQLMVNNALISSVQPPLAPAKYELLHFQLLDHCGKAGFMTRKTRFVPLVVAKP